MKIGFALTAKEREKAMAEYIDREAALSALVGSDIIPVHIPTIMAAEKRINDIPAADVRLVVKAYWIFHEDYYGDYYECSNCHDEFVTLEDGISYKHCPTCGADMREANNE